ncbi:hypothetical protein SS50377_26252 [Spironucleus salmonicida]|uniref:Uncharacterized protein n=1 Tax=Spironucleus salmonicida TaxID=348837 RepID=A0A9P8LPX1_9EUKA|nr:hypothetical protein SS50377_26252 [Spironucleus salmonicida]
MPISCIPKIAYQSAKQVAVLPSETCSEFGRQTTVQDQAQNESFPQENWPTHLPPNERTPSILPENIVEPRVQNQLFAPNIKDPSNFQNYVLDQDAVICELESVYKVALQSKGSLQSFRVNGAVLLPSQKCSLSDQKAPQPHLIQPVCLVLSDKQLNSVPIQLLRCCQQVQQTDPSSGNSQGALKNASCRPEVYLYQLQYLGSQKLRNDQNQCDLALVIDQNQNCPSAQEDHKSDVKSSIKSFKTAFQGKICISAKIGKLELKKPQKAAGACLEQLSLVDATVQMLQVWSGVAINSVVIENSSIVGARQTSGVALADGFAGLSQAKNLRKLVLHRQSSIEFPDPDCTIKNLIIGKNTDFLEELSIRLYKIENLEIRCPVLNYRFSKGNVTKYSYSHPGRFISIYVEYENSCSGYAQWERIEILEHYRYIVDCSFASYDLSKFSIISVPITVIQVMRLHNLLCRRDFAEICMQNIYILRVPENLIGKKLHTFHQIENLSLSNDEINNKLHVITDITANMPIPKNTKSLVIQTKSYLKLELQEKYSITTLIYENSPIAEISNAIHVENLTAIGVDIYVYLLSNFYNLCIKDSKIENFAIQKTGNLQLKTLQIEDCSFLEELRESLFDLLQHTHNIESLFISEKASNSVPLQLFLHPNIKSVTLRNLAIEKLEFSDLRNLSFLSVSSAIILNPLVQKFTRLLQTRSLGSLRLENLKLGLIGEDGQLAACSMQLKCLILRRSVDYWLRTGINDAFLIGSDKFYTTPTPSCETEVSAEFGRNLETLARLPRALERYTMIAKINLIGKQTVGE